MAVAAAIGFAFAQAPGDDSTLSGPAQQFTVSGQTLDLANLAGAIRVEGGSGSSYEIEVAVHGDPDAAGKVTFKTEEGDKAGFAVQYPFPHEKRFIYPTMGSGSQTSIRISRGLGTGSWTKRVLPGHRSGKVEVQGSGRGVRVWADIVVRVPAGRRIEVHNGVGSIVAEGLTGSALLATNTGAIKAHSVTGYLEIDTGSGSTEAAGIQGDVSIDTGSGGVTLSDCTGGKISVDTGSGSVNVDRVECASLRIDTGSGGVRCDAVKADGAVIDTGSGAIDLNLDRMGAGPYRLDTGTGEIDLRLPADASAALTADTGAGRIHLDLSAAKIHRLERTEAALVLGDGRAKVELDAGSGSITVSQ